MEAPLLTREDAEQLRAYVVGPDGGGLRQADSTVLLHVTHSNLKAKFIELRFDLHVSVHPSWLAARGARGAASVVRHAGSMCYWAPAAGLGTLRALCNGLR